MLRKILHILLLPCTQATFLIEKRMRAPLSGTERLQLSMHLFLCKWCMVYNKKAAFLDDAIQHNIEKIKASFPRLLIDKKELQKKIEKKLGK